MKKSELKRIIQEELKGYSKYAPGGETKGGTTDDFRNILTTIAKSVPKEDDSEEETIQEEATNIESINISYAYPGNRLYSITINGKKALDKEEAIQTVQDLTGLEVPSRAWFDDKEVLAIVDALKAKGIQADSSEMDVS
jgi:anionic cell wall polymer biosynthesis LytR-Cps2A-Psr (LCP) family protein